ncbi:MAG: HU family DNA-binding protein [Prevotella sp.]|jgi:DNA-binding protein HU-beta
MNNKEFIAELAQRAGYTQVDTQKMVTSIVSEMEGTFEEGDSVQIADFGTFEVRKRLERIVVNPATQQRMLVPPKLVLNFKPVTAIKEKLKNS